MFELPVPFAEFRDLLLTVRMLTFNFTSESKIDHEFPDCASVNREDIYWCGYGRSYKIMKKTKILESTTIYREPGKYLGWASVAATPDGTLYAVFSGDRDAHVCPFGKVLFTRSLDQGHAWSAPTIIADTPLDDRDAGICVCPDGTLVVSWFTSHFGDYAWQYQGEYVRCYPDDENRWPAWEEKIAQISSEDIAKWAPSYESPNHRDFLKRWLGFWTIRSRDGGTTWDAPALSPVYAPHGPTVLANGDLFYVGKRYLARPQGENSISSARSPDRGRTWESLGSIHGYPPYPGKLPGGIAELCEPHVVETRSGKLVGMARYEETKDPDHPYQSHLWQFDSLDGGQTWSMPRKTNVVGKPPSLCLTSGGDLMVSYGYRHLPHSHRVCLSHDDGVTWDHDNVIVLREAPFGDHGYASTAEYSPGNFLSVYYQKESRAGKTMLGATRWKQA